MPANKYELASVTWDELEVAAMQDVISSGMYTMGRHVKEFETQFARHFDAKYAVMSNSGSSANLLALAAMRYKRWDSDSNRDEVVVPAVSWSTTYYPVHQMGYRLKFVDVDLDTLNASYESIVDAVNEKTAGIVAVNLLGNPSELDRLREFADSHALFLIEDNCESMGAVLEERFAGTYGHIGTFSTYFSHHISTMEGGVCLTDDLELFQIMTSLRAHGWIRELPVENTIWNKTGRLFEDQFKFVLPGYNLRPIELAGAIGKEQLKKLDSFVYQRRVNAHLFLEEMGAIEGFKFQTETGSSSWFGFSIILVGIHEGKRERLVDLLSDANIECRPIVAGNFKANPVMKYLNHVELSDYVNADYVHRNGLFVGNHHYEMGLQIARLKEVLLSLR